MLRRIRRNPNSRLADDETLDPEQIVVLITRPSQQCSRHTPCAESTPLSSERGRHMPRAAMPPHTACAGYTQRNPRWLRFLRSLFSGLYTVDNMDFVLRDAYMSGYSTRAFDLDRLLHYSMFTERGLTIHERGLSALVRFISVRAELFRAIYFHRTVRAIDLELQELFCDSKHRLFPGDPRNISTTIAG